MLTSGTDSSEVSRSMKGDTLGGTSPPLTFAVQASAIRSTAGSRLRCSNGKARMTNGGKVSCHTP